MVVTERENDQQQKQQPNKQASHNEETIPDVSVLVSPDGALLFTSNNNHNDHKEKYPWVSSTQSSHHYPTLTNHPDEEYESAILTGNDLTPLGDYDSNGFSARGWDMDAASNTLKATHAVLKVIESFVEGVALCQKEKSAAITGCCGQYSRGLEKIQLQHSLKMEMGGSRVGPLLADGSSLTNALVEMEQYYSVCSESASERWREACCDEYHRTPSSSLHKVDASEPSDETDGSATVNVRTIDETLIQGIVPKIKHAVTKAESRTLERELALNDIKVKVAEAQDNLVKQKEWSRSHWQRVKDENRKIDQVCCKPSFAMQSP